MKIELAKNHTINGVSYTAGATLEVNEETAKAWQKNGWAKTGKEKNPASIHLAKTTNPTDSEEDTKKK